MQFNACNIINIINLENDNIIMEQTLVTVIRYSRNGHVQIDITGEVDKYIIIIKRRQLPPMIYLSLCVCV